MNLCHSLTASGYAAYVLGELCFGENLRQFRCPWMPEMMWVEGFRKLRFFFKARSINLNAWYSTSFPFFFDLTPQNSIASLLSRSGCDRSIHMLIAGADAMSLIFLALVLPKRVTLIPYLSDSTYFNVRFTSSPILAPLSYSIKIKARSRRLFVASASFSTSSMVRSSLGRCFRLFLTQVLIHLTSEGYSSVPPIYL